MVSDKSAECYDHPEAWPAEMPAGHVQSSPSSWERACLDRKPIFRWAKSSGLTQVIHRGA
jgi:hypothetical protein